MTALITLIYLNFTNYLILGCVKFGYKKGTGSFVHMMGLKSGKFYTTLLIKYMRTHMKLLKG